MKFFYRLDKILIGILSILMFPACQKNTTVRRVPGNDYLSATRIANVQYGLNKDWLGNNVNLLLDVYVPDKETEDQKFPLVFFAHGGSFVAGDKTSPVAYMLDFQKEGYVGVSIDYRLGWNVGTGGCNGDTVGCKEAVYRATQDARAALRFIVANADKYNIDTSRIFLAGSSAGAITVLNAYFMTQQVVNEIIPGVSSRLGTLDNADNNIRVSYTVKGIGSVSGCLSNPNLITQQNAIPIIFFHGEQDEVIPYDIGTAFDCPDYPFIYGSLPLYKRLNQLGVSSVLHYDPNGTHGGGMFAESFAQPDESCFFNSIMAGNPQSGSYEGTQSSCK